MFAQDWYILGEEFGWDTNEKYKFTSIGDNKYLLDVDMAEAKPDGAAFKIRNSNNEWFGLGSPSLDYCNGNFCLYKNDGNNATWKHNSGKYRLTLDVTNNSGDNPSVSLRVTGIFVTIDDQPVKNADGTYTITGHFKNTNTKEQQTPTTYQIVIKYETTTDHENTTPSGDGSFSFTKSFTPGVTYTCFARVIDNTSVGNNDSKSITFTPVKDMYITGNGSSDNWVCGKEWSPNECPLTYNSDDDVYIYTTTIETGTYQFKITNGTWDETYGYTNVDDENSYSCSLGGNSGDNNVQFEVSAESDVTIKFDRTTSKITLVVNTSCQDLADDFTISGQFNAKDGDPWVGTAVDTSGNNPDKADGVFADDHRTITLTTDVAADSYAWSCTGYSIDGESKSLPTIEWGASETTTTATLRLPGTYTFVCKATSNGVVFTSKPLTITAPAPAMGTSGTGYVGFGTWHHSDAGDPEKGLMTKTYQKLEWKSGPLQFDNFDSGQFVIIQRYKRGCTEIPEFGEVGDEGWMGYNVNSERETVCTVDGNKINSSILSSCSGFTGAPNNFQPSKDQGWTTETKLQLTVTMTDYNTYSVVLDEYPQECAVTEGFVISGQLNASDGDGSVWKGTKVLSNDENTVANDGVFADDHRTVTLSTDVVADSYEWTYQYFVDNELSQENQITWGEGSNTASTVYATLNLPGKYVFTCNAVCGGTTYSSGTVTIETYPAMGMDGPITTWGWENHSVAGSSGIMTREIGSLVWKKDFVCATNAGEGENPYEFVVIQQYKNGCVENEGWAGHEECDLNGAKYNNKINDSTIDRTAGSVDFDPDHGTNFIPSSIPAAGSNLTLYVEMTGFDSYKVWLAVDVKLKSSVATEGEPDNPNKGGNLIVKSGEIAFANGADLSEYVGKEFTISANPNESEGYKLKSITINGTTYTSSGDRVVTLTNAGLEVSAVFTLDCITPMEYTVTGGGKYCSNGGSATVNLSSSQSGINYTLYNEKEPVANSIKEGTGSPLSWNVSTAGTYTVKAIDKKTTCSGQSQVGMSGSASVTSVSSVEINASPSSKISIYQPKTYTTEVPVDWSYSVVGGDDLITMSQSETEWIVKAPTHSVNYIIQAAMKSPNQNCTSTVTLNVDNVVPWVCNPGAAGLPTSTNGE